MEGLKYMRGLKTKDDESQSDKSCDDQDDIHIYNKKPTAGLLNLPGVDVDNNNLTKQESMQDPHLFNSSKKKNSSSGGSNSLSTKMDKLNVKSGKYPENTVKAPIKNHQYNMANRFENEFKIVTEETFEEQK